MKTPMTFYKVRGMRTVYVFATPVCTSEKHQILKALVRTRHIPQSATFFTRQQKFVQCTVLPALPFRCFVVDQMSNSDFTALLQKLVVRRLFNRPTVVKKDNNQKSD